MLLNNGREVDVVGQIQVDNIQYVICKLKATTYIMDDTLVSFILLPPWEFKDYVERMKKESDSFVVK